MVSNVESGRHQDIMLPASSGASRIRYSLFHQPQNPEHLRQVNIGGSSMPLLLVSFKRHEHRDNIGDSLPRSAPIRCHVCPSSYNMLRPQLQPTSQRLKVTSFWALHSVLPQTNSNIPRHEDTLSLYEASPDGRMLTVANDQSRW